MKGGKTYEEMMASRSPESQKRILEGTERLQEEYLMTRIRRDLGMSQAERDCHEFCVHGIIGARHTGTPHEHDYQETNLS